MNESDRTATFDPSSPTIPSVPQQVGRYRVLGWVGAGGMGTVFRAEDPSLGRVVAVKVPHLNTPGRDRAAAVQRFLREARTAASVQHPNVCPIHDLGEHDGAPYVVMPFIEGPSLAQFLKTHRLDDRSAARLTARVADGLAAIHQRGIVHRDLKPGNILLAREGLSPPAGSEPAGAQPPTLSPLITDFGLARPGDSTDHLTADGAILGTPAYMSPEQASGELDALGPRSDVYSLGVILYQLLAGRVPFEGPPLQVIAAIQSRDPEPPSSLRPDLDPTLAGIVARAMARRPEDRYASALDLADDLRCWLGEAVEVPTPRPASTVADTIDYRPAPGSRARAAVAVVGVALLALAGFAGWQLSQGEPNGPAPEGPPESGTPGASTNTATPVRPNSAEVEAAKDAEAAAYLAAVLKRCDELANRDTMLPPTVPSDPGKLGRVRPARVRIEFEVEFNGAMNVKQLPFVIGVVADLGGTAAPAKPLATRKFVPIDRDNFEDVLVKISPRVAFVASLPDGTQLPVDLTFKSFDDFGPAAVAARIPRLKAILDRRQQTATEEDDLDRNLSAELNAVMLHADFRRLEGTWRGLRALVYGTETDQFLKLRVLNASWKELAADATDPPMKTALYRMIYSDELGTLGGEPFGLLVGDFEFGPADEDLRLLRSFGEIAQLAQVPFVAAASPRMFGSERFADLPAGRDLAATEPAGWQAFRSSPASRFVALTLPRVLARPVYGWYGEPPIPGFRYTEPLPRPDRPDSQVWCTAGWAFAGQVSAAVARHGWPARVCGSTGVAVAPDLPRIPFRNAEGVQDQFARSTDCLLTPRQERELTGLGFLPLIDVPYRGPVFVDARTAAAGPASNLPVMLCATRFQQYLLVLGRDRIASALEPKDAEKFLGDWAKNYVLATDTAVAAPEMRAKRPLTEARVQFRPVLGATGGLEVVSRFRPHFQFDPIPNAVELVAPLPRPPR